MTIPLKVDLLVSSLDGGGAERVAADLASSLAVFSDVRLITHQTPGATAYHIAENVSIFSLEVERRANHGFSNKMKNIMQRMGKLRAAAKARNPDVIIAIQANLAIETQLALLGTGFRVIGCEHNHPKYSVRGRVWKLLRPYIYRQMAAITVLSQECGAKLATLCPQTNIIVIPNSIRWPLKAGTPAINYDDVIPKGAQVLLGAGRLVPAKGFDELLEVFSLLYKDHPDTHLAIAGDGPLRDHLARKAESLGIQKRVHILGRVGNISDWYERASLFTMTSLWEGQPMVMMEAMAYGLPVVAYDFQYGAREIIRSEVDGYVVSNRDQKIFARRISDLLSDAGHRARLASAATQIRSRFSPDTIIASWAKLIDSVTSSTKRIENAGN